MIELLILATVAVLVVGAQVYAASRVAATHQAERDAWANERRFLIDRAIARHVGEVLALEREANRPADTERAVRPLLEGLS
jgi:hypothetical protein